MSEKIVTRYAPSPTGFQHIGGIRTAIFAYLFAKQNNGEFILRIEDTDRERLVEGAIEHVQKSLSWLNIEWDYGPEKPGPFGSCVQSERLGSYKKYALHLIEKGLAYPDPYTKDQVDKFRASAIEKKEPFLFRNHRPEIFEEWDEKKPLRLKTPETKRYQWKDEVRGELEAGEEMLDDIILIKADGYPTYNFAHIIDDLEMGVTHVMRGEEFISSTPKFLSIYDALEIPYPKFVTLPPIMGPDGKKKLSKRDGAKDILDYKNDGYLPEVMVNFLTLIGWNPGGTKEIFSMEELINLFSLDKIQRSGGAFNTEKLNWMNRHYLQTLSIEDMFTYVKKHIPSSILALPQYSEERLKRLIPTIQERVSNATDLREDFEKKEYDFVFQAPDLNPNDLLWKTDTNTSDVLPRLKEVHKILQKTPFESSEDIKKSLWEYAEEVGKGEVLWPFRLALTGQKNSPDPFTVAYILAKEETLKRVGEACDKIISNG